MHIDTTINIDLGVLKKINDVAIAFNVSRNEVLSLLLQETLKRNVNNHVLFSRVKYQKRSDNGNWHCLHIYLCCDLYEKALDLRKLSKRSVSFIIALASSQYLQIIVDKLMNKYTDNYSSYYTLVEKLDKDLYSYTVKYRISRWKRPKKTEIT